MSTNSNSDRILSEMNSDARSYEIASADVVVPLALADATGGTMFIDSQVTIAPPVGARVSLVHDEERYPHFIAPAGATGTVVDIGDPDIYAVRLDEMLNGAEDWDNEVHWFNGMDPTGALRVLYAPPVRLALGNAGWGAVDADGVWLADAYDSAEAARTVVRALAGPDVEFEDDDTVALHLPILCVAIIAAISAIADMLLVGGLTGTVLAIVHTVLAVACTAASVRT